MDRLGTKVLSAVSKGEGLAIDGLTVFDKDYFDGIGFWKYSVNYAIGPSPEGIKTAKFAFKFFGGVRIGS